MSHTSIVHNMLGKNAHVTDVRRLSYKIWTFHEAFILSISNPTAS